MAMDAIDRLSREAARRIESELTEEDELLLTENDLTGLLLDAFAPLRAVVVALEARRPNGERILDWMYEVLDGAQDGTPDAEGIGRPATVWTPYLADIRDALRALDAPGSEGQ